MAQLTVQYLQDHRNEVHNYDSFGRALADLVMQSAAKQLEQNPALASTEKMTFTADVTVGAIQPTACVWVEVCLPFVGCTKVHVGVG